ncbi:nicotinate (nicotinamide) nucleotide adenylyltransferase [Candidatus Rhabdochlamydia porcellionis]|jgi:nicotinate-nucleotide adenylyltransferase|uniref:Probable nicotinate-nucleotide adenylyltransferase n=1 Tax=Candidatus Rhabdochlamydia porcellionis TaxID=225148 RepID=A0ABX8YYV4_9BACT|nr:nicotinate (nicotinamide) nucleotide adenylyltransferase [Candidatus Rhabdochlamydia porcellionis]QZA58510.1 Nicotinate-nucleotide adenylyltransferase [Candidatus Rhabdochlamydia porcellionis]
MDCSLRKQKIGLFGGSFDPFHFGHLNLIVNLLEHAHLDKVFICPAKSTAFKIPHVSIEHRTSMLQLMIEESPSLTLLDWEIQMQKPYTIDTVKRLKKRGEIDLFLLLGEDLLPNLHLWHQIEDLLRLVTPLIASRFVTSQFIDFKLSSQAESKLKKGFIKIPLMEISSEVIRQRLQQRKFCKHLVPAKILDYIQVNHLYS